MKVKITPQPTTQIGQRELQGSARFYYTHQDHPRLLLVTHGQPLEALAGETLVAFFGQPDSTILCDVLPGAPAWWRDAHVTQCTLKRVQRMPRGRTVALEEALKQKVS